MGIEIHPYLRKTCVIRNLQLTTDNYNKACKFPGFYKWEGRLLIFRPTTANVKYVLETFPDSAWMDGTKEHLEDLKERDRIAEEIKKGKLEFDQSDDFEYKTKPYDHQRKAFLLSRDREAFALLMEMRTGKTKVVIDNAAYLYLKGKIDTLIIISVNGVHRNWIDNEIPKHMPDCCPYEAYFHLGNHSQSQQRRFEQVLAARQKLRIFAFYFDSFSRGTVLDMFESALGNGRTAMIAIDESTRIKNKMSKRSQYLLRVGSKAHYRRIMTGSPVTKEPLDVFAQFFFLDPDILGYDTITTFKARYTISREFKDKAGHSFEKIIGHQNLDELANMIAGYSYRVLRKDCMDLPPKVYKRYPVEMTTQQRALYSSLYNEYTADFEGNTVDAPLAITRIVRLQQILCNWWPMEEDQLIGGETWRKVRPIDINSNPRLDALDNIIAATEDKIIIWARFRPDLELIQRHLGLDCAVSYHGGISDVQRAANYKRFQKDPNCRFFIGNQATAGLGLELSMAGTEVYYSNSFDLEHRLQSEDRAEGPYKNGATQVIDIEVPGTMDSNIIRRLKQKKDVADLIMNDPKSFFLEPNNEGSTLRRYGNKRQI